MLVPEEITTYGEVFITGEVVCPSDVPNSQNVASGSLGLKSIAEFALRPLTFVAYDVQSSEIDYSHYKTAMRLLANLGFNVVTTFDASLYPTDGKVYRADDQKSLSDWDIQLTILVALLLLKSERGCTYRIARCCVADW